jgi:hypothetical protein
MNNRPLARYPYPVIDAHAHLGTRHPNEQVFTTLEDGIELMDVCGIARACMTTTFSLGFDFRGGNRATREAVRRFPDRLIGFCDADPRRPTESVEELDRYLGGEGFKGIKLHISYSGLPYDAPVYDRIYAKAGQYRAPVLAHTFSREEVGGLLAAARRFPEVAFLVGHSGGYAWANTLDMIAPVPNAYFDICCSCQDAGRVEAFVAAAGAERVVFGTDAPFLHPACDLSQVVHARITEAERELILGGNILRILGEGH